MQHAALWWLPNDVSCVALHPLRHILEWTLRSCCDKSLCVSNKRLQSWQAENVEDHSDGFGWHWHVGAGEPQRQRDSNVGLGIPSRILVQPNASYLRSPEGFTRNPVQSQWQGIVLWVARCLHPLCKYRSLLRRDRVTGGEHFVEVADSRNLRTSRRASERRTKKPKSITVLHASH